MDRTLNESTPPQVREAVDVLMNAETRKGPNRFLDDVMAYMHLLPQRTEIIDDRRAYHPIDDAIEMARLFAFEVEDAADTRHWKAASSALRAVEDSQQMYRMRCHIEKLRPIPGCILRGYTTLRVPRIHVYAAVDDSHLFHLPPASSQETIEAAVESYLAGYKRGAQHSVDIVRSIATNIECAVQ